jgi:two-component system response regulator
MRTQHPPILLAEDNEDDIELIRAVWKRCHIPNPLVITYDGYQAIDYLGAQPPYTDRQKHPLPCLLLLDIKMRLLDGFEVLVWLQTRPEFRHIPAVMLSASAASNDRARAQELGAVEYCVKPQTLDQLRDLITRIRDKWVNGKVGAPERFKEDRGLISWPGVSPALDKAG